MQAKAPQVHIQRRAAVGLQVKRFGVEQPLVHQPFHQHLQANGRAALDVYLRGLGLQDSAPG